MTAPNYNKDFYYLLGVSPEATKEELEEAYNILLDRYGPHVTVKEQDPEAMEKTYKEICEAWEVLSDPVQRQEYDKHNLPHLQKGHLRSLWGKVKGMKDGDTKTKEDAPEYRLAMPLTLREAIKGTKKFLKIEDSLPCQNCLQKKPVDRLKCANCHGIGSIRSDRTEEIEVAPGAYEKLEVRRPGKGKFDPRMKKHGDLVLEVQIQPHPFFSIADKDLTCTIPVTVYEAVLGAEIEVPTPTGKAVMRIQPLTQNGRVYRLKGLGIAGADLLLTIEVSMPQQLSPEEVTLFRKLNDCSSLANPRAEIFAKLSAANQAET